MTTLSVFSSEDMRRVCTRISHEIIERNNGVSSVVLIGLIRRGALLANRIANNISQIEGVDVPTFSLDISNARDDRNASEIELTSELTEQFPPLLNKENIIDLTKSTVVLVDDVLYTGRSIRASLDVISKLSRPQRIQLGVLIDRGHRELPIRADFIGKNLPTKNSERVNVLMTELDGTDRVDIERIIP